MEFYSQADFEASKKEKSSAVLTLLLAALPFLVGAVVSFILRIEIVCTICCFLCGAAIIFLTDLKVMPAMRYGSFLAEAHSGLTRKTAGALVRVSEDVVYQDGVDFREVIINVYEDMSEEGERRYLLDARKEMPPELMGKDIALLSHGNFVLGAQMLGGDAA